MKSPPLQLPIDSTDPWRPAGRAVVEVYATPYEAYDVELVADDGRTIGLLEALCPEQIEVVAGAGTGVRFADIRVEANGASAAVRFSDGKELHLNAEELHAQAG